MPVYRLPSADLLRAALVAGVVPAAVARRPVALARDGGRVWLELPAETPTAVREFLVRAGATVHPTHPPLMLAPCWAAVIPLVPAGEPCSGTRLLPFRRGRTGPLLFGDDGRAWVVTETQANDGFRLTGPGVWVRVGWRHPCPEHLTPPVGSQLMLDPSAGWSLVPFRPRGPAPLFELTRRATPTVVARRPRLPLAFGRTAAVAGTLWVRPLSPSAVAHEVLAEAGADALDGFEAMAITGPGRGTVVRAARVGPSPAAWGRGYTQVSDRLYVPNGRRLSAVVVQSILPPPGCVRWLTDDGALAMHTASAQFRPLAEWVRYATPSSRPLVAVVPRSAFDLGEPPLDAVPRTEVLPPAALPPRPAPPAARPRPRWPVAVGLAAVRPRPAASSAVRAVEARLVAELPDRSPVEQAARWAELACAYESVGRRADADGCWLSAVWCHPAPPTDWPTPDRLDGREADACVRAVWLVRFAEARRQDDPLALARCRDRLLARLASGGSNLDAPAFLRRTDNRPDPAGVREWLAVATGPIRKWVAASAGGTRLAWSGLDADRAATRRYADLLLAWGSATVGDRAATDRATTAVAGLTALRRPAGVEPAVHRTLGELFSRRVREARDGWPAPTPPPDLTGLSALGRYVVQRMSAGCDCLGTVGPPPLDTPAGTARAAADAARVAHRPADIRALIASLDGPTTVLAAGSLFRAARALDLHNEAAGLVASLSRLNPPTGGRRDLGLAIGRYLIGDEAGGDRALDAARQRLFVAGVPDLRMRGELAVAYATAAGHAAPGLALGRLDELVRRLGPVAAGGACGRYFALLPLRVVDAVVRAAVGDDLAPSPAVRRFLAHEEHVTRRRIHRDVRTLLIDDR